MKKAVWTSLISLSFLSSCTIFSPGGSSSSVVSSDGSSETGTSSVPGSSSTGPVFPELSYEADADATLEISVLEMSIQYGDATLVQYAHDGTSFDILIDAGTRDYNDPSAGTAESLSALLSEKVTDHVLDMVVLSHQHSDHYGGFENNAIQNGGITSVGTVVDNGVFYDYGAYHTIWESGVRNYWTNRGAAYLPVQDALETPYEIDNGAYVIFVDTGYYPTYGSGGEDENENVESIAMCLRFGATAVVCCGDLAGSEQENSLMRLNSKSDGSAWFLEGATNVIYKAAHHGAVSYGCNSLEYTEWLTPTYAWSSSAITEQNQTTAGVVRGQHPYQGAYENIVTSINWARGLQHFDDGEDYFFYNGTMGTFHFVFASTSSEPTVSGDGRKRADYYTEQGVLVDPEEEKDLPFHRTAFFEMLYY